MKGGREEKRMRIFEREPAPPKGTVTAIGPALEKRTGAELEGIAIKWPEVLDAVAPATCELSPELRLISEDSGLGAAMESFQLLGHRLRKARDRRTFNRLLVTSAVPREGKTMVAVNLAIVLARTSQRVLLIDADMRKPGGGNALGLPPLPGLADCLEGRVELGEVLRRVQNFGLWHIPAGRALVNPGGLVQGHAIRDILKGAGQRFDWVVVDSPPLNPFADAHYLASCTDTALMVLRAGTTPRELFDAALKSFRGVRIAGVVLNGHVEPNRQSYYSRYAARLEKPSREAD